MARSHRGGGAYDVIMPSGASKILESKDTMDGRVNVQKYTEKQTFRNNIGKNKKIPKWGNTMSKEKKNWKFWVEIDRVGKKSQMAFGTGVPIATTNIPLPPHKPN